MKMNPLIFIYICLLSISCDITENSSEINEIEPTKELITTTIYIAQTVDGINVQRPVIIQTPENIDLSINYQCKKCKKKGYVRVDVVWFGEQPKFLDLIYEHLEKTDIFLSIGTSNNVYPAAGFIDFVCNQQKKVELIEFNIEKTNKSSLFEKSIIGPASVTIEKFVKEIIEN